MERVYDETVMSTVPSHFHQFSLESLNEAATVFMSNEKDITNVKYVEELHLTTKPFYVWVEQTPILTDSEAGVGCW
jgi:hypothetical protein